VLSNLLVGRHRHFTTQPLAGTVVPASVRATEKAHRRRVEQVIEFFSIWPPKPRQADLGPALWRAQGDRACTRAVLRAEAILPRRPSSGLNVEETDDMSFWIRDMKTELASPC